MVYKVINHFFRMSGMILSWQDESSCMCLVDRKLKRQISLSVCRKTSISAFRAPWPILIKGWCFLSSATYSIISSK